MTPLNQATKRMRVLVVDDDEVTAAVLEHSMIEFGYDVTVARNGREAFELLRSGEIRMVVSDWCMPEMTGVELCRRIRQRRSGTYVYIILLTSNSSTRDVVEGLNAGADDYITKPFQPEELQVRLRVGERVLSLESRDLTIFALAKLAECAIRTRAHTSSGFVNTAASWRKNWCTHPDGGCRRRVRAHDLPDESVA